MSEQAVFEALKYRTEVDRHGTRRYYNGAGVLHRNGGPAIEYFDGSKRWYQNNRLHRTDGPAAVVDSNGHVEWYINGVEMSEADFNQRVKKCLNKRFSMH